ncbi:MAG: type II toxin-antitoxin system VapC family toxin [Caulobacteraceae bacterium]
MLVLDASIALTWCFDDEATPATEAVFQEVRDEGALVPWLWRIEVGAVLLQAERRGRIGADDVSRRLRLMGDLPIVTDAETLLNGWTSVLPLARAEKLTAYDAVYLELALRRGASLATLDAELARAAERRGVYLRLARADPSSL